jgi:Holliday junction resolvase RusA-like endonuclease
MPARKIILNLNNYPHWGFFVYNMVKHAYCEQLNELSGLVLKTPIQVNFTLYRGNQRKGDRANVLAVHEKMFCDALTHYGAIEDDNDDIIISSHYKTGEVDIKNPRVEIEIIETK